MRRIVLIGCAAFFLAGCGSSDSGASDQGATPQGTGGATGQGGSGAGTGGAGGSATGGSATGGAKATGGTGAGTGGQSAGGQSAGGNSTGGTPGTGGQSTGGAPGTGGMSTGGSPGTGGMSTGGSGTGGNSVGTLPAKFGTYVPLGDSISAGFGGPPFFTDLLVKNDDTKYPAWAGKDFTTKFGSIKVSSEAHGGDTTANLLGQVQKLPATLDGPVLVSITIGGNDMQQNIIDIIGNPPTDDADIAKMRSNIGAALDELTKPGRFGAGVDVYVLQSDIYDPTGGMGDFGAEKCPSPLNLLPKMPTDPFFDKWNAAVNAEVPLHGMSYVLPLHDTFYAHPLAAKADGWFYTDCIHPNTAGHHQLRRMYWQAVTGEVGPE